MPDENKSTGQTTSATVTKDHSTGAVHATVTKSGTSETGYAQSSADRHLGEQAPDVRSAVPEPVVEPTRYYNATHPVMNEEEWNAVLAGNGVDPRIAERAKKQAEEQRRGEHK